MIRGDLSAALRAAEPELWEAFIHHPLFLQTAEGMLSEPARDRYFRFERAFVGQAVTVFAHILTGAPDRAVQRKLVSVLDALVNEQEPLFDRLFAQAGLDFVPDAALPPPVRAFCEGMTTMARDGGYAGGLAIMFVAERGYLEASRRIMAGSVSDPALREWFALHIAPGFVESAAWLATELNRVGTRGASSADLVPLTRRALELEIAFHDAALADDAG